MKRSNITLFSKIILFIVAALFTSAIFYPVWRIELWAPQYPEGLVLQLYANKIGGNVDIINGLNHYIGMKTLHTENFPEFTFLPYLLGLFALFALLAAIIGTRKMLYSLLISFVVFGVLAAVDFYRWNYEYGHDLDPNAAIRVPGMAYQPPMIGYKQLLNFGAYSIPDIGGFLLIAAGVLLAVAVIKEWNGLRRLKKAAPVAVGLLLMGLYSCGSKGPVEIKLNTDHCDFCRMTISDRKCCAEAISEKGRIFKFDDIMCMKNYCAENADTKMAAFYVTDYADGKQLIAAEKAIFISGPNIRTPMNGGVIAFASSANAQKSIDALHGDTITWKGIMAK